MKQIKSLIKVIFTLLVLAGMVVLVVFLSNGGSGTQGQDGTFQSPGLYAMDTLLEITVQGRSKKQAEEDFDAAYDLVKEIEANTSRFDAESDTSQINASAGEAPVKVSGDTLYLVQKALEFSRRTGGVFDITVAPLAEIWGFYDEEFRVPSEEEVEGALSSVGYEKVLLDEANETVMLKEAGMQIDLGGIAKGYAVERVCELLRERGVKHALVNFGGAVGAVGRRADGEPWVIGIKHPRNQNELLGDVKLADGYVSSSGDYERYFEKGGKRYCHIFDPRTGYQPTGAIATTVVGDDSTEADMLSTALFVLGPDEGFQLVADMPGFEAVIVDDRGSVDYTPNMKDEYELNAVERI